MTKITALAIRLTVLVIIVLGVGQSVGVVHAADVCLTRTKLDDWDCQWSGSQGLGDCEFVRQGGSQTTYNCSYNAKDNTCKTNTGACSSNDNNKCRKKTTDPGETQCLVNGTCSQGNCWGGDDPEPTDTPGAGCGATCYKDSDCGGSGWSCPGRTATTAGSCWHSSCGGGTSDSGLFINIYSFACDGTTKLGGMTYGLHHDSGGNLKSSYTTDGAGKSQLRCTAGWCKGGDGTFELRAPSGWAPNGNPGKGCVKSGSSYINCKTDEINTSTGKIRGGFNFKQVGAACATKKNPRGYLAGSTANMTVTSTRTFNGTGADADGDLNRLAMFYRVRKFGSWGGWVSMYDQSFADTGSRTTGNRTFTCNSANTGDVQVVINAYDSTGRKCTGNPSVPGGWVDCIGSPEYPDIKQFKCSTTSTLINYCEGVAPANSSMCSEDANNVDDHAPYTDRWHWRGSDGCTISDDCEWFCKSGYRRTSTNQCVPVTCGGDKPADGIACSGDGAQSGTWRNVGNARSCSSSVCEYYIPADPCRGVRPRNTNVCSGDGSGGDWTRVNAASNCSRAACEYYCKPGYEWSGGTCRLIVSSSCTVNLSPSPLNLDVGVSRSLTANITNQPAGATIVWSYPNSLVGLNGGSGRTRTFVGNSAGSGNIRADIRVGGVTECTDTARVNVSQTVNVVGCNQPCGGATNNVCISSLDCSGGRCRNTSCATLPGTCTCIPRCRRPNVSAVDSCNNNNTRKIELDWPNVPNASTYEVELTRQGSSAQRESVSVSEKEYPTLPLGTYSARVRVTGSSNGRCLPAGAPWSAPVTINGNVNLTLRAIKDDVGACNQANNTSAAGFTGGTLSSTPAGVSGSMNSPSRTVTVNKCANYNVTMDLDAAEKWQFTCGYGATTLTSTQSTQQLTTNKTLKYFVSDIAKSWFQVAGGDLMAAGAEINVDLPPSAGEHLMVQLNGQGDSAGLAVGSVGQGVKAKNGRVRQDQNWSVKGDYDDDRKKENFDYFRRLFGLPTAASANLVNDFASSPNNANLRAKLYSGGGLNGAGNDLNDNVYYSKTDLTITTGIDVGGTEEMIVFVDGDVTVGANITVAPGGFFALISSKTITVDAGVAELHGVYIANDKIIIAGDGEVNNGVVDQQFEGQGTFVAWGGVELDRYLGIGNNTTPGEMFIYRPDLVVNAPEEFYTVDRVFEEVPPKDLLFGPGNEQGGGPAPVPPVATATPVPPTATPEPANAKSCDLTFVPVNLHLSKGGSQSFEVKVNNIVGSGGVKVQFLNADSGDQVKNLYKLDGTAPYKSLVEAKNENGNGIVKVKAFIDGVEACERDSGVAVGSGSLPVLPTPIPTGTGLLRCSQEFRYTKYASNHSWKYNPQLMVDNNLNATSTPENINDVQKLTDHNMPSNFAGTPFKVEVSYAGANGNPNSVIRASIRPTVSGNRWNGIDQGGGILTKDVAWTPWFDLTDMESAPSNWTMADVKGMDIELKPIPSVQQVVTDLGVGGVKVRVSYETTASECESGEDDGGESNAGDIIANGDFSSGESGWDFYSANGGQFTADQKIAVVKVNKTSNNIQLFQKEVSLTAGKTYDVSFNAKSSTGADIDIRILKHTASYNNYVSSGDLTSFDVTPNTQSFISYFTAGGFSGTVNNARVSFFMQGAPNGETFWIDDVQIVER